MCNLTLQARGSMPCLILQETYLLSHTRPCLVQMHGRKVRGFLLWTRQVFLRQDSRKTPFEWPSSVSWLACRKKYPYSFVDSSRRVSSTVLLRNTSLPLGRSRAGEYVTKISYHVVQQAARRPLRESAPLGRKTCFLRLFYLPFCTSRWLLVLFLSTQTLSLQLN